MGQERDIFRFLSCYFFIIQTNNLKHIIIIIRILVYHGHECNLKQAELHGDKNKS